MVATKLDSGRLVTQVVLVLKEGTATDAWPCQRLGEAIGEGTASGAVGGPRLKGSCGEVRFGVIERAVRGCW